MWLHENFANFHSDVALYRQPWSPLFSREECCQSLCHCPRHRSYYLERAEGGTPTLQARVALKADTTDQGGSLSTDAQAVTVLTKVYCV